MWLGLREQLLAQDGKLDVAVTVLWVKVAQKGDATAGLALMYEAHALESGLLHPHTAGRRARKAYRCIVDTVKSKMSLCVSDDV